MYEPFSLACGHTYCYSCLSQWLGHNKSCPDCRAPTTKQPVPSYIIREIVLIFIGRTQLLPDGESSEEHSKNALEERDLVAKDKADKDKKTGGLFKGAFNAANTRHMPIYDPGDGVERCPGCHWELEDGHCIQCGILYDSDWSEDDIELGLSDLDDESSNEELDHELDALDEDAFDFDGTEHGRGGIPHLAQAGYPIGNAHQHGQPHRHQHHRHHQPQHLSDDEDDSTSELLDQDDSEGSMDGFINDDTIQLEQSSDREEEDSDHTVQEPRPQTTRQSRSRRTIVISDDEDADPADSIDLIHDDSDHEPLATASGRRPFTSRASQRHVIDSDSEDSSQSDSESGDESASESENGVSSQVQNARGPGVEGRFSPIDDGDTTDNHTEDSDGLTHYDDEDSDEQDEDDDSDSDEEDTPNTIGAMSGGPVGHGHYEASSEDEDEDEGST